MTKVGDAPDLAATRICLIPFRNSNPSMISGRRFDLESFRQFPFADIISLKTMVWAVLRLRNPLVFRVRFLTVEKTLSTGLVVRMCFHARQGKS